MWPYFLNLPIASMSTESGRVHVALFSKPSYRINVYSGRQKGGGVSTEGTHFTHAFVIQISSSSHS